MYAIKQIKICAEYRDMLPRPRLDLSGTPGLRPIGLSPGSWQTSLGLGSMSRYSAQILICIIIFNMVTELRQSVLRWLYKRVMNMSCLRLISLMWQSFITILSDKTLWYAHWRVVLWRPWWTRPYWMAVGFFMGRNSSRFQTLGATLLPLSPHLHKTNKPRQKGYIGTRKSRLLPFQIYLYFDMFICSQGKPRSPRHRAVCSLVFHYK